MKRVSTGFIHEAIISRRHIMAAAFLILSAALAASLLLPSPYNLIPFVVVVGAAFVFLTFRRPMIGVVIYMLLFLIRPQELFPNVAAFQFPYERIVAIIVIINLLLEYATNNKKIQIFNLDKGVFAVMLAGLASIATTIWLGASVEAFENFLKILVFYFFLARLIDNEKDFRKVIWIYALSIAFIAISTTVNYYTGHFFVAMGIQRAVGLGQEGGAYGDPNTMATSLVMGLPFIFYLSQSYKNRSLKLVLILVMAVIMWTVIITGSRGGMLGVAVTLILIGWRGRHRFLTTVAVILIIISALLVMPSQYAKRLTTITDLDTKNDVTGAAESAEGRINGLKVGFDILLHRPLFGVGIGCFGLYNHANFGSWLNAHNLLGQLMGELGLAGVVAFSFFIYMLFKYLKYIRRKYRENKWHTDFNLNIASAIKISIMTLLFLGLFSHNAFRYNWYLFACFIVIIINFIKRRLDTPEGYIAEPAPPNSEI